VQEAKLDVRDRTHLATKCLPATWTRRDEWYDFRAAPPADATILLTIDEKSYSGGTMGDVHPDVMGSQLRRGPRLLYGAGPHQRELQGTGSTSTISPAASSGRSVR
jgi:hypothetical protein